MTVRAQNKEEEDMQALFERLQNIDNRNVRRQNKKLLNELLACLQLRVSTVVTLNVAELFYNGAPGIPTNLTMTLEYYVRAWESLIHDDITSSSSLHTLIKLLVNNLLEISYAVDVNVLEGIVPRLRRVHENLLLPQLELTVTMIEARVFDLNAQKQCAIDAYNTAKAIAVSIGDEEHALECSKRKRILKAFDQEEQHVTIEKYDKRIAMVRKTSEFAAHSTAGVKGSSVIRGRFVPRDDVDVDEMQAKMAELGVRMRIGEADFPTCAHCEAVEMATKFQICGRCKITFYCSRKCQKTHWKEHKKVCNSHMPIV